jgi:PAS domain S-box-containing protein
MTTPPPSTEINPPEGFDSLMLASVVSLIPYAVFWKDTHSRYLGCNVEFAGLVGLSSPMEIVGLTDHDLPWPTPEAERLRGDDRRVIYDRASLLHKVDSRQLPDGSTIWVDTSKVPILDAQGKVTGLVGIYADITKRLSDEKLLRETREHLDLAIDAMDSAVVLYDREERFVFCNPQYREMYGIPEDSYLSGVPYVDVLTDFALSHPEVEDIDQFVEDRISQHRKCEKLWTQEINGRLIRISDRRTENGGVVSCRTDVTELVRIGEELRKAKEEAEAANAAKSMFLAKMSHEIRTPMTAIIGFAEVLLGEAENGTLTPESAQQSLDTIKRNGLGLLGLINDILDLSKVEAGKLEANIEDVSPKDVLHDVMDLLSARAEASGTQLTIVPSGPIPTRIHSDASRLVQILVNIVGNAIKFAAGGQVTIEPRWVSRSLGGHLEIAVRDTGIGMSDAELARVFTPFTQGSATTASQYGGTGLGLSISQRLAELLGGGISAESEEGQGSCFTISMPVEATPELHELDLHRTAAAPSDEKSAGGAKPLVGKRILLAEDGPDNQVLITKVLKRAGAEVEAAMDGQAAVDRLLGNVEGQQPIDLVLMDMQMPRMDGYTATSLLREKGLSLPIIALTANAMSGDREACIAAGCDDYATKPVNFSELVAMCASMLRQAA